MRIGDAVSGAIELTGAALLIVGVALIFVPAALIVAGLMCFAAARAAE